MAHKQLFDTIFHTSVMAYTAPFKPTIKFPMIQSQTNNSAIRRDYSQDS